MPERKWMTKQFKKKRDSMASLYNNLNKNNIISIWLQYGVVRSPYRVLLNRGCAGLGHGNRIHQSESQGAVTEKIDGTNKPTCLLFFCAP
jgi:hypothetical protein